MEASACHVLVTYPIYFLHYLHLLLCLLCLHLQAGFAPSLPCISTYFVTICQCFAYENTVYFLCVTGYSSTLIRPALRAFARHPFMWLKHASAEKEKHGWNVQAFIRIKLRQRDSGSSTWYSSPHLLHAFALSRLSSTLLVVLLESSNVFRTLRKLTLFHTLTNVPVSKGTLAWST